MSSIPDFEQKLTDLEIRIAYQDDTIEQLNQVIVDQQKVIDRLQRSLTKMHSQISELQENLPDDNPVEPPPPHY